VLIPPPPEVSEMPSEHLSHKVLQGAFHQDALVIISYSHQKSNYDYYIITLVPAVQLDSKKRKKKASNQGSTHMFLLDWYLKVFYFFFYVWSLQLYHMGDCPCEIHVAPNDI
jgi:hypothetical protein